MVTSGGWTEAELQEAGPLEVYESVTTWLETLSALRFSSAVADKTEHSRTLSL